VGGDVGDGGGLVREKGWEGGRDGSIGRRERVMDKGGCRA
jgi:hypothetical protein